MYLVDPRVSNAWSPNASLTTLEKQKFLHFVYGK